MKSRKYQVRLEQDVTWAPSATQTQRLQGGVHQDQPRLLHENRPASIQGCGVGQAPLLRLFPHPP